MTRQNVNILSSKMMSNFQQRPGLGQWIRRHTTPRRGQTSQRSARRSQVNPRVPPPGVMADTMRDSRSLDSLTTGIHRDGRSEIFFSLNVPDYANQDEEKVEANESNGGENSQMTFRKCEKITRLSAFKDGIASCEGDLAMSSNTSLQTEHTDNELVSAFNKISFARAQSTELDNVAIQCGDLKNFMAAFEIRHENLKGITIEKSGNSEMDMKAGGSGGTTPTSAVSKIYSQGQSDKQRTVRLNNETYLNLTHEDRSPVITTEIATTEKVVPLEQQLSESHPTMEVDAELESPKKNVDVQPDSPILRVCTLRPAYSEFPEIIDVSKRHRKYVCLVRSHSEGNWAEKNLLPGERDEDFEGVHTSQPSDAESSTPHSRKGFPKKHNLGWDVYGRRHKNDDLHGDQQVQRSTLHLDLAQKLILRRRVLQSMTVEEHSKQSN